MHCRSVQYVLIRRTITGRLYLKNDDHMVEKAEGRMQSEDVLVTSLVLKVCALIGAKHHAVEREPGTGVSLKTIWYMYRESGRSLKGAHDLYKFLKWCGHF